MQTALRTPVPPALVTSVPPGMQTVGLFHGRAITTVIQYTSSTSSQRHNRFGSLLCFCHPQIVALASAAMIGAPAPSSIWRTRARALLPAGPVSCWLHILYLLLSLLRRCQQQRKKEKGKEFDACRVERGRAEPGRAEPAAVRRCQAPSVHQDPIDGLAAAIPEREDGAEQAGWGLSGPGGVSIASAARASSEQLARGLLGRCFPTSAAGTQEPSVPTASRPAR
ncbi:hypothetical protein ON010_g11675 [Phytophthora cinnamomi]|nr:hypothetical protein ON010_g11675 [Phytophthora cinnamomi]